MRLSRILVIAACLLLVVAGPKLVLAAPLATSFTYQGVLKESGAKVNGLVDIQASLFSTEVGGGQIGTAIFLDDVDVIDGVFSIELDFGANSFDGDARWLQIDVRPSTGGPFTVLAPRQPLTVTPYALQTRGINVDNVENVNVGDTLRVVPGIDFVGVNRNTRLTGSEVFGVRANVADNVFGGMYMETSSANGWPFYGYATDGSNHAYHYYVPTTDRWQLHVNDGVKLTVGGNGNVGIGDATPDSRLDVVANNADAITVTTNGQNNTALDITAISDATGIHVTQDSNNQIPAVRIDTTGNSFGLLVDAGAGISKLAEFNGDNLTSVGAAFTVEADNLGPVAEFIADNPAGTGDALVANQLGSDGHAISALGIGAETILAQHFAADNTSAIYGKNDDSDGRGIGVRGAAGWRGVYGQAVGASGVTSNRYGVFGSAGVIGTTNYGVYGSAFNGSTNWAGYFAGDCNVTGNLSKGGGSFRIDHPLDPENKYLYHSFVESPDMMNIYNGNVTLDSRGEAVVDMPDWFDALNRDFRYQLTPIGAPGPDLFVATEIEDGSFTIAGGTPGGKVSWQVTGIRQDPYANQNRIEVEVEKREEDRGRYLHPEAWGKPRSLAIDRAADEFEDSNAAQR